MGRLSRTPSRQQSVKEEDVVEVKREESVNGEVPEEPHNTRVATIKRENSANPSETPSSEAPRLKESLSPSPSTSSSPRPPAAEMDNLNSRLSAKRESEEADTKGHTSTSTSPVKPEAKEPSKPAKPARGAASKLPPRVAPLFHDLPDATEEATSTFTVIDSCTYQNKYLGFSEHALDCDCAEEWGKFQCRRSTFLFQT